MSRARVKIPEDMATLLGLIRQGLLFDIQEWIKSGRRLRSSELDQLGKNPLQVAVDTGFHSMVEMLLNAGGWDEDELTTGLDMAMCHRRDDLTDLFLKHGAKLKLVDFESVCRTMDQAFMSRYLTQGGDPCADNAFANALSSMKARPLLRFYRDHRADYPSLDDQAALALKRAVDQGSVRWVALLAWAGADPFRRVPFDDDDGFPVEDDYCTTPAESAIWRGDSEVLKVLKLRPTRDQAMELLDTVACKGNLNLFEEFLKVIPKDSLNDRDGRSCSALESLIKHGHGLRLPWDRPTKDQEQKSLERIDLLLTKGARWNPDRSELRYTRQGLAEHDGRYIVQVLRLITYTPGATDIEFIHKFCESQKLRAKIRETDPQFLKEITALRKESRTTNASDAAAKKGIASAKRPTPVD